MYHYSLGKKLKPAKKAWKRLTKEIQSKLHNLNNLPKVITTTTRRLITFCSLHIFVPFKNRFLTKQPHYRRHRGLHSSLYQYHHQTHLYKNYAAIYVDQLSTETVVARAKNLYSQAETSRSAEKIVEEKITNFQRKGKESEDTDTLDTLEDAWKVVVARSPQLRVDERAEEFICKFREDMKLQKEKSSLDFQEMLARGT